jgi:aminoglycoside phosphotransferase (APT) family kinase protein
MWWAGVDVLARVHGLDVGALGLGFVDQVSYGPTGLRQRLSYYERYLRWGYAGRVPVAEAALRWLRAHQPAEAHEPVLDAAATIARYEALAGRPMRDMAYYEILSGFKFTVVMARIGQLFIHYDLVPADNDFPYNNTASQLLAVTLGLPPPGGELTTPAF